ncbi:hypothetical protein ACFQ4A_06845 [Lentibacillus salinarum]|uniref:Uncharacterized protein n=2 Tax=Lentibacillus salinarum TaxID=446820 RepID=A0ABW3ZUC8_9BACI
MAKQKRRRERGWLADLLFSFLEVIIWPFTWLFRGLLRLFRHWP